MHRHRRHETKAIGHGVEIRDLDDDRSLVMETDDALRVLADLPTAILAAEPDDATLEKLRAALADMLAALEDIAPRPAAARSGWLGRWARRILRALHLRKRECECGHVAEEHGPDGRCGGYFEAFGPERGHYQYDCHCKRFKEFDHA